MRSIMIVDSYHHSNTLKIANAFAKILNCEVMSPHEKNLRDAEEFATALLSAYPMMEYQVK